MKMKSRSKNVKVNVIFTLMAQIIQVFLGFFVRKLFIDYLGVEYLGYNSVFQNILQMLNLADMGIGVAITSFLYKPIANGDKKKIASIMFLYKRIYNIIGLVVLVAGIVISFALGILIPDSKVGFIYLQILFYINLAGTVSTYYLAYNRTLIIANQKSYLTSIIDTIMYIIISVLQCIILFLIPNYVFFLVLNIVKNVGSNVIVSVEAHREFSDLYTYKDVECINEYKKKIVGYVKDVFVSRLGAYVYYSTDSLIISAFKGSLLAGFLSNYTLVTAQVNSIVTQVLSSVQATYGNYISVNDDKNEEKKMTDNYLCANFFIGNFCMLCVMFLIQPFIGICFGKEMLLELRTVILLSVNLFLTILLVIPSQVFVIHRLFKYDRPIIAISATMNIVISIVLVRPLKIDGCLIGTLITSLIYLLSRYWVISRKVYFIRYLYYIKKFGKYSLVSLFSVGYISVVINCLKGDGVLGFLLRGIFVVLVSLLCTYVGLCTSPEMIFLKKKMLPVKVKEITETKIFNTCIIFFLSGIFIYAIWKSIYI